MWRRLADQAQGCSADLILSDRITIQSRLSQSDIDGGHSIFVKNAANSNMLRSIT
jgi:hypothetical protein